MRMNLAMLGNDYSTGGYQYSFAPVSAFGSSYRRAGMNGYIGAEEPAPDSAPAKTTAETTLRSDILGFITAIAGMGKDTALAYLEMEKAQTTDAATKNWIEQLKEMKALGLDPSQMMARVNQAFDWEKNMPWIIGGGVVLVVGLFMVGTMAKRRRR